MYPSPHASSPLNLYFSTPCSAACGAHIPFSLGLTFWLLSSLHLKKGTSHKKGGADPFIQRTYATWANLPTSFRDTIPTKAPLHPRRTLFILPVYFELFFSRNNACQRYYTRSTALLAKNRVFMTEFIRNSRLIVIRTESM